MRIRTPRRAPGAGGSLPWIVRLFVGALVCGLALQLWLWRVAAPSSSTFVDHVKSWRRDATTAHLRTEHRDSEQQPRTSMPLTPRPMSASEFAARRERLSSAHHSADQKRVTAMVRWAWDGYAKYAYGHDALNVREMTGTGLPGRDMALTLVDSLDTLFLVGLFDDFDHASAWVAANMDGRIFVSGFISLFETTIRLLGGLLSAFDLSGAFRWVWRTLNWAFNQKPGTMAPTECVYGPVDRSAALAGDRRQARECALACVSGLQPRRPGQELRRSGSFVPGLLGWVVDMGKR